MLTNQDVLHQEDVHGRHRQLHLLINLTQCCLQVLQYLDLL